MSSVECFVSKRLICFWFCGCIADLFLHYVLEEMSFVRKAAADQQQLEKMKHMRTKAARVAALEVRLQCFKNLSHALVI